MAWTAQQMAEKRAKLQKTSTGAGGSPSQSAQSAASSPKGGARGGSGTAAASGGETWTADKMAAKRAALQSAKPVQGSTGSSTNQLEKAYESYRTGNNLGFADELDKRSDVLNRQKVSTSLQSKLNAADQLEKATEEVNRRQALRKSGAWTDTYTIVNNWKDSSERNRKLADLVTATKTPEKVSAADLPAGADYLTADTGGLVNQTDLTANRYTDADLEKMGYTQTEIDRARNYLKDYSNLNPLEVAARRLEGTAEGTKEKLKGGVERFAGALTQAVTSSPEEQMIRRIQSGRYTDEQLEQAGYDPELIRTAHQRIASGKTLDMADDDSNRLKGLYEKGRETSKAGERLMADATAGESAPVKFLHNAAASAAENLVVGSINPALVLPVLSAQGAGDSMAASDEKGESPEKAVLKASLKFGAGWAINSVGAADLAKTMGSDYAKDTLAGSIADWVRGLAGDSAFAQAYPAIANAVSGGIDNAMQAFVETYADKAVDAALGDSDAAKTLFSKDTFLQALESGLSGGMAGAMGGAVGTGLNALAYPAAAGTESETSQSPDGADGAGGSPSQSKPDGFASSPEGGARTSAGEAEAETVNRGAVRYSLKTDEDGKQFVQIDKDILQDVPKEQWTNTVRDAIRDLFPNGFERNGTNIANTREGRNEYTHSKSTKALQRENAETYQDKMRMTPNLDEIISASDGVENEAARHKNGESFNRAKINIRVGANDYSADVLTAIKKDGREVFYDVVNIEPTKIKAPDGTAEENTSGSKSTETMGEAGESDAGNADPNGKRHPASSESIIQNAEAGVNGQAVENTGEKVESSYADAEVKVDPEQLDRTAWNRDEQKQTARQLADNARMTTQAAQGVVDAMPEGIGAGIYAQAANSLYQLGKMEDVKSFEQAVSLTGPASTTGGAVRQVLALGEAGENALRIAYTYGKGEAEAYNARKASEIGSGKGALNPDAGTYFKGRKVSRGTDAMDAFIELSAKSSGAAIHRAAEGLKNNAKGLIRAAAGEMYLSGEAGSETVMHETFHLLNEWSPETGQAVMDRMLSYLVQQNGMENTEKLVESYLARYAESGVKMTWNQALEEITADAMETVFGTEDGFRNFVRQQAMEAKMNSEARGVIGKVMNRIDELLHSVLADVKRFLKQEPTNAAAKAAKSLTEKQLQDLQSLYFEHQMEAGEKYREALEAAGNGKNKNAPAQTAEAGEKYSINPEYAQDIDRWDEDGRKKGKMFILGRTGDALQKLGARENDIYMLGDKINKIMKDHPEMTLNEIKRIPEILENPALVLMSRNRNRTKPNTRLVMFGDVKAKDLNKQQKKDPVLCVLDLQPSEAGFVINDMQKATSAYVKDNNPVGFVRESTVLYADKNEKRTIALLQSLGFQLPVGLQHYGPMGSITYAGQNVKMEGVPFTEIESGTKYQLDVDSGDVEAAKTEGLGVPFAETEAAAEKYSLPEMARETESEKTKRQMEMVIRPAQMNAERTARVNENEWSGLKPQEARKAIKQVLTEFGIQNKNFSIDNVDFEFRYGNNNIHESTSKQTELTPREYHDFSLVQANIEEVIRNAVPLEAHSDKKGKPHVDGMIVLASALQDGERVIPVRAELKLYDNRPTALYFAIAETTAEESRNAANKKELDRQVRQEPLLTQEAALPSSSDLTITDFYNLVKHDANFTKYFSDEVAYQAEDIKELQKTGRELESERRNLKEERERWMNSEEVKVIEAKKKSFGLFSAEGKAYKESAEYQSYLEKRKELNWKGAELDDRIGEIGDRLRETNARLEARRQAIKKDRQLAYDTRAREAGGKAEYRRQLAVEKFGTTDAFERAGYILPDGQMLDFAQNGQTRDTDHREIMDVFGPAEVSEGTDALNAFLADGNVRVMAEAPGVDLAADKVPTEQQLEQIRSMAETLGAEKKKFTLDISGADGRVADAKDYSGRIDADRIVREIREYYKTGELPAESSLARFRYQLDVDSGDVEAAKTEGLGNVEEQNGIVGRVMDLAGKVAVSDTGLKNIARAVLSDCDSRMDTKTLTERLRALSDYIRLNPQVDWAEANAFVMDMADQIMQKSAKRNDELWKAYPELHRMGMTIEKGSKDYQEIRYRWGSWANAKKELARHGVDIRQSKEGEHSRWDADFTELQKLGAGLLPDETPSSAADALAAMAVAHDAIRPVMENCYGENWEEAQQDLAMQIWQRYMESPEIASEKNAPLRKEFAAKRQEVRDLAKQQAAEAKAKAEIARLQAEQMEKDALVRPYLKMTQQAIERQERAEHFAKMQRLSVAATVQQAKDRADKRVEKARNAREMDNTRRVVRSLTSQLTQMTDKPSEKAYVPEYLLDKVRPVVMLANDAIGNHEAARKLAEGMDGVYGPIPAGTKIRDAVEDMRRGVAKEMENGDRAALEWQQSGVQTEIDNWLADVNENRQIEMEKLRGEIENANKWLTEETPEKKAYLARLNADLKAYQDGNMATLTMDQLKDLRDILEKTMTIVKNENILLGSMEDVMIDDFAEGVSGELKETGAKQGDSRVQRVLRELGSVYRLNTMNIERNFERMGGYRHGGYMEQLGQMLNDGQFRKERITAEGERIFANVTGPEHAEELHHFTHDLVDIGLKTKDGKPWLVTHDVMTELWVQLQNRQGMHHLLHGGATIADMSFSTKGMAGLGEQYSETVTLGELATTDEQGNKLNAYEISQREDSLRSNILAEIEKNLTPYDEQWIKDFRELGKMTKQYINETSMILYHTKRARVDNYIRLHVDKNTLVEQNEGVRTDRSVGSEGFMKTRQTSSKPLELVGLVRQASESIENTAQFAGMAVPLRNAEKVLNSMQDGETLYGGIERVWGRAGRNYMTKAMADLTGAKSGSEVFDRLSGALRGAAAAAVLTGNLNVTLLQAASLPTAAAELGWNGAGQSAIQFAKNISGKQRKAIEERAYRFGDALLPTRMRGSQRGELSRAAKEQGVFSTLHDTARNSENRALRTGVRAADAVADAAAGSIGWMDEVTVASLFYGSEQYVQKNPDEYGLTKADLPTTAQEDGTKAYQNAVLAKFQRVVERTQPNYTAMQRTGMQRTSNQLAKTLMMFSTQRQQNAQIMVSAIEDLAAQQQRYRADKSAENKAELEKAGKRMADAVSSQIVQTAVIAGLGLAVKFALHRWDDLQDENGDMTFWSLANNFIYQFFNSGVSNYTGGSEVWTAAEMIRQGKIFASYDTISMTGFSAVNDVVKTMAKLNGLLSKDTDEMDEEDFAAYEQSVRLAWADTAGQLMMLVGVPYNNGKKYVQAVFAWMDTIHQWGETGKRNFNSLPASATGQYDRLYNAIRSGDSSEAQAALEKLEAMGKGDQIDAQLKRRLKQYSPEVEQAAKARNAGNDRERQEITEQLIREVYEAFGVREGVKADAARRTEIIDLVTGAIDQKADALLAGDKDRTVWSDLTDALDTGKRKDVQEEIDRLRRAGKEDDAIRSKITAAVKDEYVGGNDHDRAKLEELLLSLQKADGTALYEEKTLTGWVTSAEKKAQADKDTVDEWAAVR